MTAPNKSLGQHWLKDRYILSEIADAAQIRDTDMVLEIGPGLGTLTSELLKRANNVVAVEFDSELARKLPAQFPGKNLSVTNEDILSFDLNSLPKDYVVVANVPYYITSKIVQLLLTAENKPRIAVLLVQKEVAERIAAGPGEMSILAIAAQVYAEAELGTEVPREYFTPPPQVDSQVIILKTRSSSFIDGVDEKHFFRIVKAGFAARRKKLRSSLSAGLSLSKEEVEQTLISVSIDPNSRAQDLSINDWLKLADRFHL
jgi:16S rRNA (adenine1518-N6/adenine1519-N6)-dimethyltransferase